MNAHHRFHLTPINTLGGTLLLGFTIALATPALRYAEHNVRLNHDNDHQTSTSTSHDVPASDAIVARYLPDPSRALTEMYGYAAHHLTEVELLPETLNADDTWSPDWYLYSLDVQHNGETIRIYHATHKHHPSVRFNAMWLAGGATDWEAAQ